VRVFHSSCFNAQFDRRGQRAQLQEPARVRLTRVTDEDDMAAVRQRRLDAIDRAIAAARERGPDGKPSAANGDGNLIYPCAEGPCSTIRLKNIRDGIEGNTQAICCL
jgi:hypothetical protein